MIPDQKHTYSVMKASAASLDGEPISIMRAPWNERKELSSDDLDHKEIADGVHRSLEASTVSQSYSRRILSRCWRSAGSHGVGQALDQDSWQCQGLGFQSCRGVQYLEVHKMLVFRVLCRRIVCNFSKREQYDRQFAVDL